MSQSQFSAKVDTLLRQGVPLAQAIETVAIEETQEDK